MDRDKRVRRWCQDLVLKVAGVELGVVHHQINKVFKCKCASSKLARKWIKSKSISKMVETCHLAAQWPSMSDSIWILHGGLNWYCMDTNGEC